MILEVLCLFWHFAWFIWGTLVRNQPAVLNRSRPQAGLRSHLTASPICVVQARENDVCWGGDTDFEPKGAGRSWGRKNLGWGIEYLHQLSARLLGWRRSCDPPATELEPPAEKQPVTVLCNACTPAVGSGANPAWPVAYSSSKYSLEGAKGRAS